MDETEFGALVRRLVPDAIEVSIQDREATWPRAALIVASEPPRQGPFDLVPLSWWNEVALANCGPGRYFMKILSGEREGEFCEFCTYDEEEKQVAE